MRLPPIALQDPLKAWRGGGGGGKVHQQNLMGTRGFGVDERLHISNHDSSLTLVRLPTTTSAFGCVEVVVPLFVCAWR